MAKATTTKPMTKSALLAELSTTTGLNRKQVASVFDELHKIIKAQMKKTGVLNVMRLVKVYRKSIPAQKAGARPNPFKPGEMMEVKARPARNVVKVRPLKDLKDLS
jgi:nucleoid DNA-binding protein